MVREWPLRDSRVRSNLRHRSASRSTDKPIGELSEAAHDPLPPQHRRVRQQPAGLLRPPPSQHRIEHRPLGAFSVIGS